MVALFWRCGRYYALNAAQEAATEVDPDSPDSPQVDSPARGWAPTLMPTSVRLSFPKTNKQMPASWLKRQTDPTPATIDPQHTTPFYFNEATTAHCSLPILSVQAMRSAHLLDGAVLCRASPSAPLARARLVLCRASQPPLASALRWVGRAECLVREYEASHWAWVCDEAKPQHSK